MSRDEFGMPVPEWVDKELRLIAEARDIVRRLATSKGVSDLLEIAVDAEKLWTKMQSEVRDES